MGGLAVCGVGLLAISLGLSGCGAFFVCEGKSDCPVTTTPTNSGDYAYVANTTSSTSQIAAYELSTGNPLVVTGSPFSLDFVPNAMVVSPDNSLLFVSSPANGAIYAFTIAADGALSSANGGVAVDNESASAMDISPDGKYLFVLNTVGEISNVDEFEITATTGVLTAQPSLTPIGTAAAATAAAIKVAPSGDFLVVTLGSAGDVIVPLVNELFAGGGAEQPITFTVTGLGDYAVTIDSNNNIYFARTGQVAVYSATSAGVPTAITNTLVDSATGAADNSIVLSSSDDYVYTGNAGNSSNASGISGFSNSSGTLAPLSGSPYGAPNSVDSIALDSTGKYIVAAGYGTGGFREYTIGSSGVLTVSSTTENTGTTSNVTVMAVTH
jgi:6-phosphogluconolactonase (cycloisomerase 2 family)